jgi:Domain of unknown function (DUF4272)
MPICQTPQEVAKRAIILGVMNFRSSLEVTKHPRVKEISNQLLPWLLKIGCEGQIDPIEREELETPLGKLSPSQLIDINWAGESAFYLCWALRLIKEFDYINLADTSIIPSLLKPLELDAFTFLKSASLRPIDELEISCKRIVLIRSMMQEMPFVHSNRVAAEVIRKSNLEDLQKAGINTNQQDIEDASNLLKMIESEHNKRIKGKYASLPHPAKWLFSNRQNYWDY